MFIHKADGFRTAEIVLSGVLRPRGQTAFHQPGMLAGSLVETQEGWRPVETLVRGARVETFDGGSCRITEVDQLHLCPGPGIVVIEVPGGALDNCAPLRLMPGQRVLLAAPEVQDLCDAAGALVPAVTLVGYRGIARRMLVTPARLFRLQFETDEIVYVNSGTLLQCDTTLGSPAGENGYFAQPQGGAAEALIAQLIADEARGTVRAA